MDLVSALNSEKMCSNVTQLNVTMAYIGEKTAYKLLVKSYLGYWKNNNTDDTFLITDTERRRGRHLCSYKKTPIYMIQMIIIQVYTMYYIIISYIHSDSSLGPIVGAGRPAETWSGSSL